MVTSGAACDFATAPLQQFTHRDDLLVSAEDLHEMGGHDAHGSAGGACAPDDVTKLRLRVGPLLLANRDGLEEGRDPFREPRRLLGKLMEREQVRQLVRHDLIGCVAPHHRHHDHRVSLAHPEMTGDHPGTGQLGEVSRRSGHDHADASRQGDLFLEEPLQHEAARRLQALDDAFDLEARQVRIDDEVLGPVLAPLQSALRRAHPGEGGRGEERGEDRDEGESAHVRMLGEGVAAMNAFFSSCLVLNIQQADDD
jgi:hypothetical protein